MRTRFPWAREPRRPKARRAHGVLRRRREHTRARSAREKRRREHQESRESNRPTAHVSRLPPDGGRIARVRATGVAATLLVLAADARAADGGASGGPGAHATGVLCLRKLPAPIQFATEGKGGSGFHYEDTDETRAQRMAGPKQLEVSVDGGAIVIVDQKAGACIDGLALGVKHVVRSIRPGVSRQCGRFSFAPDQTILELRYDPFYGNVRDHSASKASNDDRSGILRRLCNCFPCKEEDVGRRRPRRSPARPARSARTRRPLAEARDPHRHRAADAGAAEDGGHHHPRSRPASRPSPTSGQSRRSFTTRVPPRRCANGASRSSSASTRRRRN